MTETANWEVAPVLRVRDVRTAAAYYRDRLGFECPEESIIDGAGDEGAIYAFVRRGGIQIHLGRARSNQPAEPGTPPNALGAYLYVPEIAGLYEEFKRRGANIIQEPAVAFYGLEEIVIVDVDGYIVTFGAPPRATHKDSAADPNSPPAIGGEQV
jgi:uncharacterized glyoxalase superfamily protein PhnB